MSRSKNKILLYNAIQTGYADPDNSPSYALMALSAFLKKKGYEVELLFNRYSDDELKNALKGCLAVGFSLYTGGSKNAFKIAARIKQIAPEIPLVWGGYHPTLETQQCLENKWIEYAIRGQGELIFEELLEYFKNPKEKALADIKGLSFKQDGQIYHNETRASVDINEFPRFDYDLYGHVFKEATEISYITSRGCPFACKFCCSASFNRNHGMRFYQLSLERVFADLEFIVARYNPEKIIFMDDNFFIDRTRIDRFVQEYKQRGFRFKWKAFGRCNFFAITKDAIIKGLKEIGLEKIYFGVESGSQRILDMVNKKIKVSDVLASLEKIKRHDIWGDFTFINGFPDERKSDVYKSIELRNVIKRESPKSTIRFFAYTPLPGTETLEECIPLGYKKPVRVEDWESYEFHSFKAPWLSSDYQSFVNNISWASQFVETDPDGFSNPFVRFAYWLIAKDAQISFRYKLFGFAPEFKMIDYLYRRKLSGN
jgi:anaerobic magnesium-protoporphyrin IX monomethyl ester cyclase